MDFNRSKQTNSKNFNFALFQAYGCLIDFEYDSTEWPLNLILHSSVIRFILEPCLYGKLRISLFSYDIQYSHKHQRIE